MSTQLSKNFNVNEFKSSFDKDFYVFPEKVLVRIIQNVRDIINKPIIITDGPRTVLHHIKIYKRLEKRGLLNGRKWHSVIPWGSRHLSRFGYGLRAVDLKCVDNRDEFGGTVFLSGEIIKNIFLDEAKKIGVFIGLGIGKRFIHIDVDRKSNVSWSYSY